MKKFDLVIAYRIYPEVTKPTFIHEDDKLKLAAVCLSSLVQSAAGLHVRMHCICDGCPDVFIEMLQSTIPSTWTVSFDRTDRIGNYRTFSRQIDFLKEHTSDGVLSMFAEDDYYYLPGALESFVQLLAKSDDWDYATPYRHPNVETISYWAREIGPLNRTKRVGFRYVPSTCLTFLVKDMSRFNSHFWKRFSHQFGDGPLWVATTIDPIRTVSCLVRATLRWEKSFMKIFWRSLVLKCLYSQDGSRLIEPTTNISTHAEKPFLSKGTDWIQVARSSSS